MTSKTFDGSWYHDMMYVYLKLHATEPSWVIHNTKEIDDALVDRFGCKENLPTVLGVTSDGEHRFHFISVKIANIVFQRFLNADIIVARPVPGHSYRKPHGKVNCYLLILGLYSVGCMWKEVTTDQYCEKSLHTVNRMGQVCSLLNKNKI